MPADKPVILFIDDAPDILMMSGIRLKKLGHEVLTASSGDEGIKIAEEAKPALIFLDIMMPGKDGIRVCREIKSNPALKHVPVILFSALSKDIVEEKVHEAGADGYIIKPFEPDELLGMVNKYCAGPDAENNGRAS